LIHKGESTFSKTGFTVEHDTTNSQTSFSVTMTAPLNMDVTDPSLYLYITIVFSNVEMSITTETCTVVTPSVGTNTCTWGDTSAKTLLYTGNAISAS
jgi:hypothetical protein